MIVAILFSKNDKRTPAEIKHFHDYEEAADYCRSKKGFTYAATDAGSEMHQYWLEIAMNAPTGTREEYEADLAEANRNREAAYLAGLQAGDQADDGWVPDTYEGLTQPYPDALAALYASDRYRAGQAAHEAGEIPF